MNIYTIMQVAVARSSVRSATQGFLVKRNLYLLCPSSVLIAAGLFLKSRPEKVFLYINVLMMAVISIKALLKNYLLRISMSINPILSVTSLDTFIGNFI